MSIVKTWRGRFQSTEYDEMSYKYRDVLHENYLCLVFKVWVFSKNKSQKYRSYFFVSINFICCDKYSILYFVQHLPSNYFYLDRYTMQYFALPYKARLERYASLTKKCANQFVFVYADAFSIKLFFLSLLFFQLWHEPVSNRTWTHNLLVRKWFTN